METSWRESRHDTGRLFRDRRILSWALYDWANSAYATTVMAGFFPVFFKQYWSPGVDVTVSTFRLGVANSIASLMMVLLAPVLGAIADASGAHKRFLLASAAMGVLMSGALYLVAQGHWLMAVTIYVFGLLGFSGGNVFYDALLVCVAPRGRVHAVSSFGFALGYLGGGLLFAFNVSMSLAPDWFGLAGPEQAVRWSFLTVAVWWAVFTIPLLVFVTESRVASGRGPADSISHGIRQLIATLRQIRRLRMVALFLGGYWCYIDGVDTIVRMAVDYGLSLGFEANALIVALLITQFVGFPAALMFGVIGQRLGPKTGIFIALTAYIVITVFGFHMERVEEFYILAAGVGLVQGGIQALSRSLYTELIPAEMAGEFFGFYNILGRFAAVVGPVLMGWTGWLIGDPRYSILSITVLFVAGGILLALVDVTRGRNDAVAFRRGDHW